MAGPFDPQNYYDTLTQLYSSLFGRNWHLGYWLNASTFAEAGERLNAAMIDRLHAGTTDTVVDVGCGVGGPACDIAAATGANVVGISNSAKGIENAAAYAAARGLANRVRFELADALELPFKDASVDAVFSCEAVHNVVEKAPLARELARVLKPGGRMVVGDLFLLRPSSQLQTAADKLKSFSFHLFEADEWIAVLRQYDVRVTDSVNIGHHVGPKSFEHCTSVCLQQASRAPQGSLEHVILTRTAEATSLLGDGFRAGDLGWGIWSGARL
jgi:cyclopropane fatty-acyl-phospholipid synthase-like methyltransferase